MTTSVRPLHPLVRLCGRALLATLLIATLGAPLHRDHSPEADATCVVHHWTHAGATALVSAAPSFLVSHTLTVPFRTPCPALVALATPRTTPARAPPPA